MSTFREISDGEGCAHCWRTNSCYRLPQQATYHADGSVGHRMTEQRQRGFKKLLAGCQAAES